MKTKAANILSSIKYELCIFILLIVQAIINISPYFLHVGEYTRLYYLIDFSMGKTLKKTLAIAKSGDMRTSVTVMSVPCISFA